MIYSAADLFEYYNCTGLDLLTGKFFSEWTCTPRCVDPVGLLFLLRRMPPDVGDLQYVTYDRWIAVMTNACDAFLPDEECFWRYGLLDAVDRLNPRKIDYWSQEQKDLYDEGYTTGADLYQRMDTLKRVWHFNPPPLAHTPVAASFCSAQ